MLEKLESLLISKKKRTVLMDILRNQVETITSFFDGSREMQINQIEPICEETTPNSIEYNKFLDKVEKDISFLHYIQGQLRDNMLASWNITEGTYGSEQEQTTYDMKFNTGKKINVPVGGYAIMENYAKHLEHTTGLALNANGNEYEKHFSYYFLTSQYFASIPLPTQQAMAMIRLIPKLRAVNIPTRSTTNPTRLIRLT